jgi:hypothetical protein
MRRSGFEIGGLNIGLKLFLGQPEIELGLLLAKPRLLYFALRGAPIPDGNIERDGRGVAEVVPVFNQVIGKRAAARSRRGAGVGWR